MALMPPDGSPVVSSYADLRRAMERAQYDPQAALVVRNFLMESAYYRSLVASGQMNQNQYFVALENLRQLQKDAAEKGYQFSIIETSDQTGHRVIYNPPVAIAAPPKKAEVEKKPPNPFPDVHFTSHQRVGDQAKDAYTEHVHDMFARGYINQREHDARIDAMMLARTKEEMEFLVQDLPEIRMDPPEVKTEGKKKEYGLRISSLLSSFAGFTAGMSVFASSGGSDLGLGVFIILLALSIVSAIIFGVSVITKHS